MGSGRISHTRTPQAHYSHSTARNTQRKRGHERRAEFSDARPSRAVTAREGRWAVGERERKRSSRRVIINALSAVFLQLFPTFQSLAAATVEQVARRRATLPSLPLPPPPSAFSSRLSLPPPPPRAMCQRNASCSVSKDNALPDGPVGDRWRIRLGAPSATPHQSDRQLLAE